MSKRLTNTQRKSLANVRRILRKNFPGVTDAAIGRVVGITGGTVKRISEDLKSTKKANSISSVMEPQENRGRKPVLTQDEVDKIRNMRGTTDKITKRASKKLGRKISSATVYRVKKGIGAYKKN